MVEFEYLSGKLMGNKIPEENDYWGTDRDEDLYSLVIFDSDVVSLRMDNQVVFQISESDFVEESGNQVYYPYQNETSVEIDLFGEYDNLDVVREDISIKYATVDSEMYICSQNEITAYSGTYIVKNNQIYRIMHSLLARPNPSTSDDFLDIPSYEEPVNIQNVKTGCVRPIEYDEIADIVENGHNNGALRVRNPSKNPVEKLVSSL